MEVCVIIQCNYGSLKLKCLDQDASGSDTSDRWYHWKTFFGSFLAAPEISSLVRIPGTEKLTLFIHHSSVQIYTNIFSGKDNETVVGIFEKQLLLITYLLQVNNNWVKI